MAEKVAKFSANGGPLEVEIVIGQIKRGDFEIVLFDRNDSNPILVGKNRNGREISYKYLIERPLNELDGSLLMWDVIIGASTTGSAQTWSITLIIRQNGQAIEDGVITNRGEFEIITHMADEVRLRVI
jgi:hypothetical protein